MRAGERRRQHGGQLALARRHREQHRTRRAAGAPAPRSRRATRGRPSARRPSRRRAGARRRAARAGRAAPGGCDAGRWRRPRAASAGRSAASASGSASPSRDTRRSPASDRWRSSASVHSAFGRSLSNSDARAPSTVAPPAAAEAARWSSSRDLPIPGSPSSATTAPGRAGSARSAPAIASRSRARPTSVDREASGTTAILPHRRFRAPVRWLHRWPASTRRGDCPA